MPSSALFWQVSVAWSTPVPPRGGQDSLAPEPAATPAGCCAACVENIRHRQGAQGFFWPSHGSTGAGRWQSLLPLHPSAQRAVLARCPDTGTRAEAAPGLLLSTPGHDGGTAAHPSAAPPALRCPQARCRPRAGAVPSPGAVQGGTGCVCLLQGTARLCRGGVAAAASLSLADPVPSWQQGRGVSRRSRPSCGCRRSPRQVQGRRRTWGCLCPVPML